MGNREILCKQDELEGILIGMNTLNLSIMARTWMWNDVTKV